MGFLVEMDERMTNMDERIADIRAEVATKDDLERAKEELTDEIRAISRAQDKDARAVVDHEKRIAILEQKAGVAAE